MPFDLEKTTVNSSIHGTIMTVTTTSITTVTTTTTTISTSTTTSSTSSTSTSTTTTAPCQLISSNSSISIKKHLYFSDCHTMVTFDDISGQSGSSGIVSNGYKILDWVNVNYINGSSIPNSGFDYGVTSDPYVAYSPNGITLLVSSANGTHFSFDSVVVTSAWRDDLEWTLHGSRGGTSSLVGSIRLQVMNRTTITCTGCTNWDAFYFSSSGGIPRAGLAQNGTEFVFDDLCISFGY